MLPVNCGSCNALLNVTQLKCDNCKTEVNGTFEMPVLASLSSEDQQFIMHFVKSSGSLKEMASAMKLSYPTVRNLLNEIIQKINLYEK
jgi:hypothetical protein